MKLPWFKGLIGICLSIATSIGLAASNDPLAGVQVGTTQVASKWLSRTVIRIQDRALELTPGTAAFDLKFTHNGRSRKLIVIRPEPATQQAPAVLMMHGNSGSPQNQANLSVIAPQVAARGVWVFLPEAADGVWTDDPSSPDTSKDDVGFLGRVIDIAVGGYGADASRVYAAGLSNGGFMAQRLACQLSDRIAAVGVVAAALRNGLATACSGGTPRPISFIVGSADPIVPYAGAGNIRSADSTLAFWAARNGCIASAAIINDLPDSTADGTTVRQTIHQVCGSGRDVIGYTVNGGGHAWPGGWQYLPVSVIGKTSTDISASATLLDFFARYTR